MTQYASSVCIRIYTNVKLKDTKLKTKCALTLNTNNRKWHQLQFQPCLVTESHGRGELGLLTSSAVVHLQEMMPRTRFRFIRTLCEQQIY